MNANDTTSVELRGEGIMPAVPDVYKRVMCECKSLFESDCSLTRMIITNNRPKEKKTTLVSRE